MLSLTSWRHRVILSVYTLRESDDAIDFDSRRDGRRRVRRRPCRRLRMLTPIELMKATVDKMAERGFGRVVNITSGAVKAPIDILGLSNGARTGLTGFVGGLARSRIAARGVTINGLLPGAFDTERLRATMQAGAAKAGRTLEAVADDRRRTIPAQRFGSADEFGAICAFLCSVPAGYITGQNILADGGAYPGTF